MASRKTGQQQCSMCIIQIHVSLINLFFAFQNRDTCIFCQFSVHKNLVYWQVLPFSSVWICTCNSTSFKLSMWPNHRIEDILAKRHINASKKLHFVRILNKFQNQYTGQAFIYIAPALQWTSHFARTHKMFKKVAFRKYGSGLKYSVAK
jgi:hypothetical protein